MLEQGVGIAPALRIPAPADARGHRVLDAADLHRLGVDVRPYMRLYGTAGDTVYLQHTASGDAVEVSGVDTVVLSLGHVPQDSLYTTLTPLVPELHAIGDCMAPRTAEEAIYDGLKAGCLV
mgnify:CR=1 FL=1